MGTHKICLYKEVDKKYLKKRLFDCALIGVCAVIRSNKVTLPRFFFFFQSIALMFFLFLYINML